MHSCIATYSRVCSGGAGNTTQQPIGQVSSTDQSVQCDPLPKHDLKCMRNRQACGPRMLAIGPPVQSGMSATSETSTVHAVWLDRSVCFLLRETRRCRNSESLAAFTLGRLCQARFRDMARCEFGHKVTTGDARRCFLAGAQHSAHLWRPGCRVRCVFGIAGVSPSGWRLRRRAPRILFVVSAPALQGDPLCRFHVMRNRLAARCSLSPPFVYFGWPPIDSGHRRTTASVVN